MFDAESNAELTRLTSHEEGALALAWHPKLPLFATSSRLVRLDSGGLRTIFQSPRSLKSVLKKKKETIGLNASNGGPTENN